MAEVEEPESIPEVETATAPDMPMVASVTTTSDSEVESVPASVEGGAYRVQAGAFRDQSDAQNAWAQIKKRHPNLFSGYPGEAVRADLGAHQGVWYRFQVDSFGSQGVAAELCNRYKRAGCFAVRTP